MPFTEYEISVLPSATVLELAAECVDQLGVASFLGSPCLFIWDGRARLDGSQRVEQAQLLQHQEIEVGSTSRDWPTIAGLDPTAPIVMWHTTGPQLAHGWTVGIEPVHLVARSGWLLPVVVGSASSPNIALGILDRPAALESTGTDDAISILTRDGSTRWSPWQLVTTSLQFAPRLFIAIATSFLIAESLLFVFFPKQIQARTDYITSTETKAAIDQGKATGQAQSGSAQQKIDDLKRSIDPSWWEGQQKLKPNPDAPASDLAAVVGLQTAAEYWGSDCAAAKDFMAKEYNGDEYTVSGFHFDAKAYNTSKTNFTFGVENPNYAAAVDLVRRMCGGSDSVNSVTTAWSGYTGEQVYDQGEYRAKAEYDRVSADVQDRDKLLEANPKLVKLRAQLGTSMEATQKNASDAQSNIQQIAKDFGTLSAALDSFISDQTPQTIEPNPAPPCLGNIAQEALCRVTRYFNYPSPNGLTAGMLRILFLSIELMPVLAKLAFSVRRRRPYETLAAAYEVINEGAQVKLVSEHLVRIGGSIESDSHMRRALRSVSTADMMDAELALASQRRYWRGWILALPTSRRRLRGWLHWVNEPDDPTAHMPPPSQRAGSEPLRQAT